ncbi:MAG: hypothetical protein AB1696_27075 [Planctomycetota bacterium]
MTRDPVMTTDELIQMNRTSFADALRDLDHNACEKHVRALLKRLNGPSFETYVMALTEVAVRNVRDRDGYYSATKQYFSDISKEDDILGRLCLLALKMMVERLARHATKLQDEGLI